MGAGHFMSALQEFAAALGVKSSMSKADLITGLVRSLTSPMTEAITPPTKRRRYSDEEYDGLKLPQCWAYIAKLTTGGSCSSHGHSTRQDAAQVALKFVCETNKRVNVPNSKRDSLLAGSVDSIETPEFNIKVDYW